MNNSAKAGTIWERSTVARFVRWLCSWRGIRRLLIILAWLVTAIALVYGIENWRGWRAWKNYRSHLSRGGAELDFKSYLPKAVPDDQNFAALPVIKDWFDKSANEDSGKRWADPYGRANSVVPESRDLKPRGQRIMTDLVAWKEALAVAATNGDTRVSAGSRDRAARAAAAPAVLEALKTNETVFAELRAAMSRPSSVYPVRYDVEIPWGILLPHLANLRAVSLRLQLKASAELALDQSEAALHDIELILRVADSVREEPSLISQLVRVACFHVAVRPIWEGLVEHRWSPPQLDRLRTRLGQFGFLSEMQLAIDAERACVLLGIECIRENPRLVSDMGSTDGAPLRCLPTLLASLAPSGWYRLEQANYCVAFDLCMRNGFDARNQRVFPSQFNANHKEFEQWLGAERGGLSVLWHHKAAVRLFAPSWSKLIQKMSAAQTVANQAVVACTLEAHRLAQGRYPDSLDALNAGAKSSLPGDLFTGNSFRYKKGEQDGFRLYSVGWNEKDDGGVLGEKTAEGDDGDWVWVCP